MVKPASSIGKEMVNGTTLQMPRGKEKLNRGKLSNLKGVKLPNPSLDCSAAGAAVLDKWCG